MYDKFGEMSSYKEINELAENLANEVYKRDADWKKTKKKETQAKYHPEKRRKMLFVHAVK